ncbi:unnamed protein product [Ectocarpus sp. 13 AM-2016]
MTTLLVLNPPASLGQSRGDLSLLLSRACCARSQCIRSTQSFGNLGGVCGMHGGPNGVAGEGVHLSATTLLWWSGMSDRGEQRGAMMILQPSICRSHCCT